MWIHGSPARGTGFVLGTVAKGLCSKPPRSRTASNGFICSLILFLGRQHAFSFLAKTSSFFKRGIRFQGPGCLRLAEVWARVAGALAQRFTPCRRTSGMPPSGSEEQWHRRRSWGRIDHNGASEDTWRTSPPNPTCTQASPPPADGARGGTEHRPPCGKCSQGQEVTPCARAQNHNLNPVLGRHINPNGRTFHETTSL